MEVEGFGGGGVVAPAFGDVRERGLDVTRPILAVLDGFKALSRAVKDVSGKPVIQRCHSTKSGT